MLYRLLALDVDGTILDPAGELRPAVRQAVRAVQRRGIRVVLCTGRRFRTALPMARELQIEAPMVVHNGALVKDPASGQTLHRTYMPTAVYHRALDCLRQLGVPMVYVDAVHDHVDILTEDLERAHPFQREYLQDNLRHCRVVDDIHASSADEVIMISIMGDGRHLRTLRPQVETALGRQARVNVLRNKNYHGCILEILQSTVSKWKGLQPVAAQEGIAADAIVAIGDDENDIEMIRHAALGIAMGNAGAALKAVADHVTGSNAEDGVVQAIERFLLR